MEGMSKRNESGSTSDRPSETQEVEKETPCTGCQNSTNSHFASAIPPEACNVCAGSPRNDSQPSVVPIESSNILCEQQQILIQPHQYKGIHRLPFEMFSSIFVCVKDAINGSMHEEYYESGVMRPEYRQPSQSPPLLVGAVCRKWRMITLTTPSLWTDIIIDLSKDAHGQFDMIKTWATRSGALPLDIILFISLASYLHTGPRIIIKRFKDGFSALRSLAVRWNDVGVKVPSSFCLELFSDLQQTPSLNTLLLEVYGKIPTVRLQHHLCPKRLLSASFINIKNIPFKWDRLVFLDIADIDSNTILHIIQHAQNLRHCSANAGIQLRNSDFDVDGSHITAPPITSHSLIFFSTHCDVLERLTLPSLLHLHYTTSTIECLNLLTGLVDRSCAPLHDFFLEYISLRADPFPSFESLPGITSLLLTIHDYLPGHPSHLAKADNFLRSLTQPSSESHTILPCLKILSLEAVSMSDSSWNSLSLLWKEPYRRKLSRIVVHSAESPTMSKTTFLNLLEDRASGLDFILTTFGGKDLFKYFANLYGIEL